MAKKQKKAEPATVLYGCPDCGCTDIEGTAWVHINDNRLLNCEPPNSEYWCPQCETHFNWCEEVKELRPYKDPDA